ncbi:flagellar motor switch protein FliN [Aurantimonas sp. 22II-16-19i]|uniref:flagellar motor switch protein FliN n=1 Tax=Aurantimonas sp. 22II-16-19i TaxID=1317114 RepID=UPI0009F7B208|nr:flagellar motor switch protein FliN [Aurantimonas sp. 22II-16-19i]ORE95076.1 flagellar motor switch protein [Aurantimonas sp. 22II-16-19i]
MTDSELDLDLEDSDEEESDLGGFEMPTGFDPSAAMGRAGAARAEAPVQFEQAEDQVDLNLVMDVPVTMQVVLGSATMTVANILKLGRGAVVKLDTKVGDPVDVVVNGRIVARGEIVVIDKEEQRFGITLTDVAKPGSKLQARKSRAA